MLKKILPVLLAILCSQLERLHAELALAAPFRDGVVLQRGKPVPVWGTASPGEPIKVQFKDQTRLAEADKNGRWVITLDVLAGSAEPARLVVTGRNTVITVKDVVVGEVWLCSGQSNMNLPLTQALEAKREIANAKYPLIHYFEVKSAVAGQPLDMAGGEWKTCSPQTAGEFTAVGYSFARELQPKLGVPVAIIKSSLGGSPIEAWLSQEALAIDPAFAGVAERWNRMSAGYRKRTAAYETQLAAWKARKAQAAASREDFTEAQPVREQAKTDRNKPSGLYNGLLHPLEPFALAGFLWYQGEGNVPRANEYARLFATMVRQWRRDFQQGALPFLFVQLPLFAQTNDVTGQQWAWLREAQATALSLPNTGMAVALDVGETNNLHPRNKQEVGRRLALVALRMVYGRSIEDSGPVYAGVKREDASLRIQFEHARGLRFGGAASDAFELAGSDRKFMPAEARVEGEAVVVSAKGLEEPVAVRFAWKNVPDGFLFNSAGLPAAPFRSDKW